MTKSDTLVSAIKAAGTNGASVLSLRKRLGGAQAVHSAACDARKKGFDIKYSNGVYTIKSVNQPNLPANVPSQNSPSVTALISGSSFADMDPASKADYIEQVRRATLHMEIAKAILRSFALARSIKEKM